MAEEWGQDAVLDHIIRMVSGSGLGMRPSLRLSSEPVVENTIELAYLEAMDMRVCLEVPHYGLALRVTHGYHKRHNRLPAA